MNFSRAAMGKKISHSHCNFQSHILLDFMKALIVDSVYLDLENQKVELKLIRFSFRVVVS